MLLDFEVQRCTRRCAASDRPLLPGDLCFSMLEVQGADVVRQDFCSSAWNGPSESSLGWWKSRIPEPTAKKIKLAPNEVLLELFDQLAEQPEHSDMRYILMLLLIRRRVLRLESQLDSPNLPPTRGTANLVDELATAYCPKRDSTYEVRVAIPTESRIDEIQRQLSELLMAGAE